MWEQVHYLVIASKFAEYSLVEQLKSIFTSQFWFLRILFLFYALLCVRLNCYCFLKKWIGNITAIIISFLCFFIPSFTISFLPGMEYMRSYSICFVVGGLFFYFKNKANPIYVRMLCV